MARDELVAPLEGTVIPLPHQVHALARAMSSDRVRYLLADEVGLGKTIEAGLIFRELKIRGLVRRVLVVAPAGLVTQWVQELKTHFDETFRLVIPSDLSAVRELVGLDEERTPGACTTGRMPLDSVKPLTHGAAGPRAGRPLQPRALRRPRVRWMGPHHHRRGTPAGWFDGSGRAISTWRGLGQASPYLLLLLSATPHQGKTDGFRRLISFLDPQAFPDDESVSQAVSLPT